MDLVLRETTLDDLPILFEHQRDPVANAKNELAQAEAALIEVNAEVARQVRIPLATGERLTTKTEFGALLRAGGVKILQPALGRLGGILEARKLAAIAEIFNAEIAPHLYAGPVEWAANIHLSVSIPNLLMAETIQKGGDFRDEGISGPRRFLDKVWGMVAESVRGQTGRVVGDRCAGGRRLTRRRLR